MTAPDERASGRASGPIGEPPPLTLPTGVGIAAEDLQRIFEEFGQARNQHGQTEGTGLGLALVKRYAELHGGSVRVESEVGRGSTFTVSLPVLVPSGDGTRLAG